LIGIEGVPALKKLHLRHNRIEKIEEEGLPELPALEWLSLRTNKVAEMNDISMLLKTYPTITDLNILDSAVELEYSSMNVLIGSILEKHPTMKRFCKVTITDKHRLEAVYLAQYKHKKETERKAKEAAEERAREEAEAAKEEG
jgi:Leucine-rich repeat (LRR) protein